MCAALVTGRRMTVMVSTDSNTVSQQCTLLSLVRMLLYQVNGGEAQQCAGMYANFPSKDAVVTQEASL